MELLWKRPGVVVAVLRSQRQSLMDVAGLFPRPPKPGGYADSSADIAHALRLAGVQVLTPVPDPINDVDWSWPDTEEALMGLSGRASVLWMNAMAPLLHPFHDSRRGHTASVGQPGTLHVQIDDKAAARSACKGSVELPTSAMVWQDSRVLSEHRDRYQGEHTSLESLASSPLSVQAFLDSAGLKFPVVCKPVSGRGSEGVELVRTPEALVEYSRRTFSAESETSVTEEEMPGVEAVSKGDRFEAMGLATGLRKEVLRNVEERLDMLRVTKQDHGRFRVRWPKFGPAFLVEEFLEGVEITVTVMPGMTPLPWTHGTAIHSQFAERVAHLASERTKEGKAWALPPVIRMGHDIMPYNGAQAVVYNSTVSTDAVLANALDGPLRVALEKACVDCAKLSDALGATAPIRVDLRLRSRTPGSSFVAFDVNLKPNATGPGRPGRDDQASLWALAAAAEPFGMDYPTSLLLVLERALRADAPLRT
jgi:D-alanine-D-alanine ligase